MKPSHAWALFVLISIATALWFVFSQRYSGPPADFAALELTKGDFNETGSCYSLHNVLIANDLTRASHDVDVLWTERVKDEWHLRVSRGKAWREFWFVRDGERVLPLQYVVSDDREQKPAQQAIDELLGARGMSAVPRLARCSASR